MLMSNLAASKLTQLTLSGAAVIAVAVADVLLKKATAHGSLERAIAVHGCGALYALIVLAARVLLYRETLTPVQIVAMALAISGVVLINWR